jgi:hypothetical protein
MLKKIRSTHYWGIFLLEARGRGILPMGLASIEGGIRPGHQM